MGEAPRPWWWSAWARLRAWCGARPPAARGTRPDTGLWGEAQAEAHLRHKGFRIVGRRVRLGRRDELDLVARDGDTLVFVEVKTRQSEAFGRPVEAVDRHKRHVLSRAAVRYLKRLRQRPAYIRFDVVEVVGSPGGEPPRITHLANAFPLDRCYRLP